jgi:hypothetical protein
MKLETLLDEDAYKEMELKRARIGILSAVAYLTIPADSVGSALTNFLHLPPMNTPEDMLLGLSMGNTVALVLFLISVPKCAILADYWNSVKEQCEEECCELNLDDNFDPLGLRQTRCMVNEAARRAKDKFLEDNSPTKLQRIADPDASPSKRLRSIEKQFEQPAAMLIFLYLLELLASNTCVLRETSMIFDAIGNIVIHGMEGDIQFCVEKWLKTALEVGGNVHDMLHSVPSLASKVDTLAHNGQKMCEDAGNFCESILKERVEEKFRLLEVDAGGPSG